MVLEGIASKVLPLWQKYTTLPQRKRTSSPWQKRTLPLW